MQVKGKRIHFLMHLAIVRQAIYTRSCSPFLRWNLFRLLTYNYGGEYFLTKPVKVVVIIWCKCADFSVILEIKEIFNVCTNVKSPYNSFFLSARVSQLQSDIQVFFLS